MEIKLCIGSRIILNKELFETLSNKGTKHLPLKSNDLNKEWYIDYKRYGYVDLVSTMKNIKTKMSRQRIPNEFIIKDPTDIRKFTEEQLKILSDLISYGKIYIAYEIYNGGGRGKIYDMSSDNTELGWRSDDSSNPIVKLPSGGLLPLNKVEELLRNKQYVNDKCYQNDGDMKLWYHIDKLPEEFDYSASW